MEETKMTDPQYRQGKMEQITRKWWFFGLFVLLWFVVPPYASKGYKFPEECSNVIYHVLGNAIIYSYSELFPIFKIVPILLIVSIFISRNKVTRLFNTYVAVNYVVFALGQSISVTEKYGVAICTINLIMFLVVAALWIWEAFVLQNDFIPRKRPTWKYWVVPLALLAFWYPINLRTGQPDFNPIYIFTSPAGVAFCLMTPVYIGLLTLYWPKVNIATLRVTSLVGLSIGIANMFTNFLVRPSVNWWNGVLHIPLLVISLYGLVLSLKRPQAEQQTNENIQPT